MRRKYFCGTKAKAKIAAWLYAIWFIKSMWTSFYDLSDLESEKY